MRCAATACGDSRRRPMLSPVQALPARMERRRLRAGAAAQQLSRAPQTPVPRCHSIFHRLQDAQNSSTQVRAKPPCRPTPASRRRSCHSFSAPCIVRDRGAKPSRRTRSAPPVATAPEAQPPPAAGPQAAAQNKGACTGGLAPPGRRAAQATAPPSTHLLLTAAHCHRQAAPQRGAA